MNIKKLTDEELVIEEKVQKMQYVSGVPDSWFFWTAVKVEISNRELETVNGTIQNIKYRNSFC